MFQSELYLSKKKRTSNGYVKLTKREITEIERMESDVISSRSKCLKWYSEKVKCGNGSLWLCYGNLNMLDKSNWFYI
jgi:hypothetical protein